LHAKLLAVDGWSKTAVSSVNWSHASYMKNREAGAVISGDTAVAAMMAKVYEGDWAVPHHFD
jgi:phosphatidylserine/phosphatidylglycerophosphate/cardiolipin synthase-like enzyme